MEEHVYGIVESSILAEITPESDLNHNSSGNEERPKNLETIEEICVEDPNHDDTVEEICIEATDIYKEVANIMKNDSNVMTANYVEAAAGTCYSGFPPVGSDTRPLYCRPDEEIIVGQAGGLHAEDDKPGIGACVIVEQVAPAVSSPPFTCDVVRTCDVAQSQKSDFQNCTQVQTEPNINEQFVVEQGGLENDATYEIENQPEVDLVQRIFSNNNAKSNEVEQSDLQEDFGRTSKPNVGSGFIVEQSAKCSVPTFEVGTKPQAGIYFVQKNYLEKAVRQNLLGIDETARTSDWHLRCGVANVESNSIGGAVETRPTGLAEEIESTGAAEVNAPTHLAVEIGSKGVAEVNTPTPTHLPVEIGSTVVAEVNAPTGRVSSQLPEKEDVEEVKDTKTKRSDPDYGRAMEKFMEEHTLDLASDNDTIISSGTDHDEGMEIVTEEPAETAKVSSQAMSRHEKGAFGIIAPPGENPDGLPSPKGTLLSHPKRKRDEGDATQTPGPSNEPSVSYTTTGIPHRRESQKKKRKLKKQTDGQTDERLSQVSPFHFECLKCGNVFKNTGDVCPCTQNTGVPKQAGLGTGFSANTGVTQGHLNTKHLVAMATDVKQKLSEETGKSDNGNTENTGVKAEKMTGKKNARTRMIWYKIPDEFDAEKLKVLSETYVCAKCDHKGDINGCSCKKPAIFGTKMFRYKCLDHCGREFFNRRDYENHQRMHLNVRPFACGLCDKTFTSKNLMNRHIQVHVGEKAYECDECHKRFMFKRDMEIHTRTHTGEKSFICEQCGNAYINETNLQIHTLVHTGEEPFRCKKCERVFLSKSLCDIHMLSHSGEGPFPCQFCGRLFNGQSNLIRHKKRVHKDKNQAAVTCYSCRATFDNCDALLEHCQQHYTEPAVKCKICGKEYMTKVELEAHGRKHQSVHAKPFKCDECARCFLSDYNLQKHRKLHTNGSSLSCWICDEKFTDHAVLSQHRKEHQKQGKEGLWCKICKKGFANVSNFVRHRKAHNLAESPHICSECGAVFATNWKLKNHKVLHFPVNPFTCKNCPKTFKNAENLKAHQKSHSETKPFICPTCGKCFRLKAHLEIHKRVHTGVYPFKCKECGRNFICTSNLKAHMLTRHSHVVYKIGDATVSKAKKRDEVRQEDVRQMNEKGDAYPISVPVVAFRGENEARGSDFRPRKVPMATATVSRRKRPPRNLSFTLRGRAEREVMAVDYSATGLNRDSRSDPHASKLFEFSDQNVSENVPNSGPKLQGNRCKVKTEIIPGNAGSSADVIMSDPDSKMNDPENSS